MEKDPLRTGTPLGLLYLAGNIRAMFPDTEIHLIDTVVDTNAKYTLAEHSAKHSAEHSVKHTTNHTTKHPITKQSPNMNTPAQHIHTEQLGNGFLRCGMPKSELEARLSSIKPDLVGISNLFTSEWDNARHCAAIAKKATNAKVVLGGHHSTYAAEFMLMHTPADYVVLGEGELPFLELIKAMMRKIRNDGNDNGIQHIQGIAGVFYDKPNRHFPNQSNKLNSYFLNHTNKSNRYFLNLPSSKKTIDLDSLADPAFDLLNPKLYGRNLTHSGALPEKAASFIDYSFSRGCPIGCNFCTSSQMWGKLIRTFSSQRIKRQIQKIRNLGFDHLYLEDDNLLLINPATLKSVIEELGSQGMSFEMDGGLYYPLITKNKEILNFAANNGLYRVFLPVEHPLLAIVHKERKYHCLKKQEDVKRTLEEACNVLNTFGIKFYCAIIVGFPNETIDTLNHVEEYAHLLKKLGAEHVRFFYHKLFPGTIDYERYYKLVEPSRRWQNGNNYGAFTTPVLNPFTMDICELEERVNKMSESVNGATNTLCGIAT